MLTEQVRWKTYTFQKLMERYEIGESKTVTSDILSYTGNSGDVIVTKVSDGRYSVDAGRGIYDYTARQHIKVKEIEYVDKSIRDADKLRERLDDHLKYRIKNLDDAAEDMINSMRSLRIRLQGEDGKIDVNSCGELQGSVSNIETLVGRIVSLQEAISYIDGTYL